MGIELKTKQGHITLTAPKASGGGSVDLSNYYTKAQTDEKIAEAVENVSVDLTGYATEEYVQTEISKVDVSEQLKDYATEKYVDDRVAADTQSTVHYVDNNFVTKEDWETIIPTFLTDIPSEYVTESELSSKGYVNATYVQTTINENIPDVSGYQTEEQVNTLISNALAEIGVAEQGAY